MDHRNTGYLIQSHKGTVLILCTTNQLWASCVTIVEELLHSDISIRHDAPQSLQTPHQEPQPLLPEVLSLRNQLPSFFGKARGVLPLLAVFIPVWVESEEDNRFLRMQVELCGAHDFPFIVVLSAAMLTLVHLHNQAMRAQVPPQVRAEDDSTRFETFAGHGTIEPHHGMILWEGLPDVRHDRLLLVFPLVWIRRIWVNHLSRWRGLADADGAFTETLESAKHVDHTISLVHFAMASNMTPPQGKAWHAPAAGVLANIQPGVHHAGKLV